MNIVFPTEQSQNNEHDHAAGPEDEVNGGMSQMMDQMDVFYLLFEQSPLPQVIFGPQLTIQYMNQQGRRLLAGKEGNQGCNGVESLLATDMEKIGWTITELAKAAGSRRIRLDWRKPNADTAWDAILTKINVPGGDNTLFLMTLQESTSQPSQTTKPPQVAPTHQGPRTDLLSTPSAAKGAVKVKREHADENVRKSEMLTMIGQLAAGVAHEIRNPLTSIKGFLQLIQTDRENWEKREYFEIMMAELGRIEFIISEFLLLAKPQFVNPSHKNIIHLLQNIIVLVETHAILNNVQITLHVDRDLPLIKCEENQLKQAFINVMKNAIEAMPDGGELMISVGLENESQLLIQFIDEGVGVPEEIMPKLGGPFYTTKEKGTGLGLMVSYKIIEDHQGTITVKSQANAGTTVEIRLPIEG